MNKSIIIYPSFIIACFIVIGVFVTATTFTQLAAGILIYPLLVLLAYKLFAHKLQGYFPRHHVSLPKTSVSSAEKTDRAERSSIGIADIDKRVFLKLIGGTGLTLFLFSLFNKKVADLFPSNIVDSARITLKDTTGNTINPAQSQPLDGYRIAEIEDNTVSFYGFTYKNGAWYIMRIDTDNGSFRYARGESNFPGNWSNRENLKYDYFSNVFSR